jgi:phosphopantetheine--protein transferase-like protein
MHPTGNDVVDLQAADNRRSAANPRYAQRVLSSREYASLTAAAEPERLLWSLWSAKEAAYKSLSPNADLVFSQREFVVHTPQLHRFNQHRGQAYGSVVHGEREVAVRWYWTQQYVHCVSGAAATAGHACVRAADDVCIDLDEHPRYTSMPASSQAVRALAHELLDKLGTIPADAWISRRVRHAPQIVAAGRVWPGAQVSLSHDGRFVAAAVSRCQLQAQPHPD